MLAVSRQRQVGRDPCADCGGRGAKSETSTLSVSVPAGVADGQTLRIAGRGECAPGGTSGDLYVVLSVARDDRFERDGDDVVSEIPISVVQAALGGEVEIDTLDDGCEGTAILELRPARSPAMRSAAWAGKFPRGGRRTRRPRGPLGRRDSPGS